MLLIYIFIIIILVIILSIKQIIVENFKTFSNTQELGLDEKDIINRGINFDAEQIINKIPLIQYPNIEKTNNEINILLKYQNDYKKNKVIPQGIKELDMTNELNDYDISDKEKNKILLFIENTVDPIIFHFKTKFNRVRPSYYDNRVKPWLSVPNHPSYPSGHSVQSFMIAHILSKKYPHKKFIYFSRAKQISLNREIMGLHYPSDTKYGKIIAKYINENTNFYI